MAAIFRWGCRFRLGEARTSAGNRAERLVLLYTGAAYVAGEAPLMRAIEAACLEAGAGLTWQEIDPDVFGEELAQPAYRDVERIAAVGAIITTSDARAVAEP